MIELSLLLYFSHASYFNNADIDHFKMNQRKLELTEEFLRPYVIDSNSKE